MGQGPRICQWDALRALKPTRPRNLAKETRARTSAKRMLGIVATVGPGRSRCATSVARGPATEKRNPY